MTRKSGYLRRGRASHRGTCQRCNEFTATARYADDGTTFQRLTGAEGGHWLCKSCVDELEQKRDHVRTQLAQIRRGLPGLDAVTAGDMDDVSGRLDGNAQRRSGEA